MKKIIKLNENDLARIIKKIITESQQELDTILDKISEVGYDGLNPDEQEYIDFYSKTGKFLPTEKPNVSFNASDSEEAITDEINGMNFRFLHEDTWEDESGVHHSGYFSINGDEFYGKIDCSNEGYLMKYSFEDPEQLDIIEQYGDRKEDIELFLIDVCDELKGGSLY